MPSAANYNRMGRATQDVQSYIVTSVPRSNPDGSGSLLYGSGYLGPVERIYDQPFQLISGGNSPRVTPGFSGGNYIPPIKALNYSHTKTSMGSEGFSETYFVLGGLGPSSGPGSAGWKPSRNWYTNIFSYSFGQNQLSSWSDSVRDKANRNLLSAIKNSTFNAGIATAERQRTMDMVASAATRIAKAGLALKRGQFSKAAQNLGITPKKRAGRRFNRDYPVDQAKAVGNAWLELQYGWKPLMNDVYGSVEALAKAKVGTNSIFVKRTGYASREERLQTRTNFLGQSELGSDTLVVSTYQKVFVKTGATYSVTSPRVNDMKQIGLTNPLLIAWELVPFSFVADWFLPVGNYLNTLDATLGLTFFDGYVSIRFDYSSTYERVTATSDRQRYRHTFGTHTGFRTIKSFTRTITSSFPSAPRPVFKNPISTSHVASAMALLLQTFKR